MKIHVNDTVEIVKGKDKGKTGKVEKVFPRKMAVLIGGVNQFKRHSKPRLQNQPAGIITITKPLPVSNIALLCTKCKKKTRVGYLMSQGKKVRVCRKCDEII
jgi:large subunit ribosomal protein L24